MLYQIDQTGASAGDVFAEFWLGQQQAGEELRGFAERLVAGVVQRRPELDRLIREAAEHWRLERMAVVDRNVLRLAVYEMQHEPGTPSAVVIDEAIEVSRKYGSEDSATFINGVLDAIRRRLSAGQSGAPDLPERESR